MLLLDFFNEAVTARRARNGSAVEHVPGDHDQMVNIGSGLASLDVAARSVVVTQELELHHPMPRTIILTRSRNGDDEVLAIPRAVTGEDVPRLNRRVGGYLDIMKRHFCYP